MRFRPRQRGLKRSEGGKEAVGGRQRNVVNEILRGRDGSPVEGVPMWSAKLYGEYDWNISNDVDMFARTDWDFTGHSHGTFLAGEPDFERPSYSIMNASLGAYIGNVAVSLYAKNLLNEQKIIQQPLVQVTTEGYRPYPRIIGLNASYDF